MRRLVTLAALAGLPGTALAGAHLAIDQGAPGMDLLVPIVAARSGEASAVCAVAVYPPPTSGFSQVTNTCNTRPNENTSPAGSSTPSKRSGAM